MARMTPSLLLRLLTSVVVVLLTSCGGSSDEGTTGTEDEDRGQDTVPLYYLSGTLSGLDGLGGSTVAIELSLNEGQAQQFDGDSFQFTQGLTADSAYEVAISTKPEGFDCSIENASGILPASDVINIAVTCQMREYRVAIGISGLNGSDTLGLSFNGADSVARGASGYETIMSHGDSFSMTLIETNSGYTCSGLPVSFETITSDIAYTINCLALYEIAGTVLGHEDTVEIVLNRGTTQTVTTVNSRFSFGRFVVDERYSLTLSNEPPGQDCFMTNGAGILTEDVNAVLTCHEALYSIGGSVSNLTGTLMLSNNNNDQVTITQDGRFQFGEELLASTSYTVTIDSQPIGQICSLDNFEGPVVDSHITNITVSCADFNMVVSSGSGPKLVHFQWSSAEGATTYRLSENVDGNSGFELMTEISSEKRSIQVERSLLWRDWAANGYLLEALDHNGAVIATTEALFFSNELVTQLIGYIKASNAEGGDQFGNSLALSGDGKTLAVGATGERSNAVGIDGDQNNNSAYSSGAVYLFTQSTDRLWKQSAYIKASNAEVGDEFGDSLALSGDGKALAVGAAGEASNAVGINGDQSNNDAPASGAVYLFRQNTEELWEQSAYIKASNAQAGDVFGNSLALSSNGNVLAVKASAEASNAVGINGDQSNNDASNSGAVYLFRQNTEELWEQSAYIKASNTGEDDYFGDSLALSGDGKSLAVGAAGEDSNAVGINGDQSNNDASYSGAVYLFRQNTEELWEQSAYIKALNAEAHDGFGGSLALSDDGKTLAVGAYLEDSDAVGINGEQSNNNAYGSGAVYLFSQDSEYMWEQSTYIKASNTDRTDGFGRSLALSGDGKALAVGAGWESSNATGINGDQSNDYAYRSGAVYLFTQDSDELWKQSTYIKASNSEAYDEFSRSLALSEDGKALAVGAGWESSNATGINGDQSNNNSWISGVVYLY